MKAEKSRAWFDEHNAYCASPQWRDKRARVLRRSGGVCEACLDARATHVHHVTYDHWKHEPCFDLRAVCEPCHEKVTEIDRANRTAKGA